MTVRSADVAGCGLGRGLSHATGTMRRGNESHASPRPTEQWQPSLNFPISSPTPSPPLPPAWLLSTHDRASPALAFTGGMG